MYNSQTQFSSISFSFTKWAVINYYIAKLHVMKIEYLNGTLIPKVSCVNVSHHLSHHPILKQRPTLLLAIHTSQPDWVSSSSTATRITNLMRERCLRGLNTNDPSWNGQQEILSEIPRNEIISIWLVLTCSWRNTISRQIIHFWGLSDIEL